MYISYNVKFTRMKSNAARYVVMKYNKIDGRLYLEKSGRTYASLDSALNKLKADRRDGYIYRTGTMQNVAFQINRQLNIL